MNSTHFVNLVVAVARRMGCGIETNRNGLTQINFGHKKLHARHLEAMFPEILEDGAHISAIIDKVAPGRPCTFKLMREIIAQIRNHGPTTQIGHAT